MKAGEDGGKKRGGYFQHILKYGMIIIFFFILAQIQLRAQNLICTFYENYNNELDISMLHSKQ